MLKCPECQKDNVILTTRCWNCGHDFSPDLPCHELPDGGPDSPENRPHGMYPGWTFSGR